MTKKLHLIALPALVTLLSFSLVGCGGGSGGGNSGGDNTSSASATFTTPDNVPSNSTFTVSVSLSNLGSNFQVSQSTQKFTLELTDTGSRTPKIICKASSTGTNVATLGGAPAQFTCTTPTANESDIGEHELTVSGPDNLTLENQEVDVNLVSKGSVTATATPALVNAGQNVTVTFSGQQGATGQYTLSNVPQTWFTNKSNCKLSAQTTQCSLAFKLPLSQLDGPFKIIATADKFASSLFSNGSTSKALLITVRHSQAPKLELQGVQGISSTLYTTYNLSSLTQTIHPKYEPILYFKNTTNTILTITPPATSLQNENSSSGFVDLSKAKLFYGTTDNPSLPMTQCSANGSCNIPAQGYLAIKLP